MFYKAIAPTLSGKRILVPESDVISTLADMYHKDPNKDYYVSVFKYEDKHKEMLKNIGSLSGIKDVKTNTLIFDFDSKSDIEKAKQDSLTLIGRLTKEGLDSNDINIYFSSNKGFHVELNTDVMMTREEADAIRTNLTSDLETVDTSVKDEQRVIRAPLSKNPKSNLYKIPLTTDELINLSVDQIREEASNISDFRYELAAQYFSRTINLPEEIKKLSKVEKKEKNEVVTVEDKPDFSKNKTGLTNAKYALLEGYFEEGERHEAVMILASTYKALGWHKEITYNSLKAALRLRSQRFNLPELDEEGKRELWKEVESVYSLLWRGGTYSEDEGLLKKTKERYNIDDRFTQNTIVDINELRNATISFLKNLKDNRIYTGLQSLDKNLILTRGMLFGVVGCAGSGKTSFLNTFVQNTSKNFGPVFYLSADMSKDLLGTKLIQSYTGYSLEKLEDMILHGTYDKIYLEAVDRISEDFKNVGFCFENGYDVNKIDDEMKRFEDKMGQKISLTGIDYLEKVVGPYSDETANSGYNASNLANLAKKHDTCIGLLLQPSKQTGLPSDELKSYRAIKGSSRIEQDCRAIVGIWRPGYDPENFMRDRYMSVAILKQNMGKLGRFDFMWNGAQGSIKEMTTEERRLFGQFLEELKQEKMLKDEDL